MIEEDAELRDDPTSYRDCLKVFNFVYNHFQSLPSGRNNLCSALFEAYNKSIANLSNKTEKQVNDSAKVVSFPETHISSAVKRKCTAGFL